MATVYEIIQGINQAAANAYDGAQHKELAADGLERRAGLWRENGDYISDQRVMDGFKVRFIGPILRLSYQAETRLKDVKRNDFEDDIISKLKDIVKFLKKEYKTITGDTLTLTLHGDHKILVQRISNYRTDVQAHGDYKIGGMKDVDEVKEGSSDDRLEDSIKKWLELGPKNKRPSNDTRKGK
jgi:hypothetical protein